MLQFSIFSRAKQVGQWAESSIPVFSSLAMLHFPKGPKDPIMRYSVLG